MHILKISKFLQNIALIVDLVNQLLSELLSNFLIYGLGLILVLTILHYLLYSHIRGCLLIVSLQFIFDAKPSWSKPYTFITASLLQVLERENSWGNRACGLTADRKLQLFATGRSRLRRVHVLAGQQALLWKACFVFHTITPHEKTFHNTVLCFILICPTSFPVYFSSVVSISLIPFS